MKLKLPISDGSSILPTSTNMAALAGMRVGYRLTALLLRGCTGFDGRGKGNGG